MIEHLKHRVINKVELKYCGTCKEWVDVKLFGNNKNTWDKVMSWCLSCSANYRASLKKEGT